MDRSVSQGKYKIIPKSSGPLYTSGLATCSAISFIINDSDLFMAHIDANTNVADIANQLNRRYSSPVQYSHVKIWYGSGMGCSDYTQKLIKKFTNHIGIETDSPKELEDDIIQHFDQQIVECRLCKAKSGTLKIISHCYNCKYANSVLIKTVGFMDKVSTY